jgi:zinc transport system substrate-binding protein
MVIKRLCLLLAVLLLLLSGCGAAQPEEEGLLAVATLFPQYDFAREIAGEQAQVVLLLPPGVESHSYEPTPADILLLEKADIFLYTGEEMEPWAARILEGLRNDRLQAIDVTQGIPIAGLSQEEAEEGHAHTHAKDPHVWTSPVNARRMAENIAQAFSAADPAHAAAYAENALSYDARLEELDGRFRELVQSAKRDEIVFAGRFAFRYLFAEYGLRYIAAYDSCSSETEPNARAVAEIIDKIREDKLPAVYYEELVEPRVARSISEETGAQMLLLHSCHNLSLQEQETGENYLSLMNQNLENLKKGLNG